MPPWKLKNIYKLPVLGHVNFVGVYILSTWIFPKKKKVHSPTIGDQLGGAHSSCRNEIPNCNVPGFFLSI